MEIPTPKDETITQVLVRLEANLGAGAFVLADHWADDLMAVGIARPSDPRYLVYITTLGCATDHYHVELELPPSPNDDFPYTPAGSFDSLDYAELLKVVKKHLAHGLTARTIDPPPVSE
jgi:hypothetical protein